jgi:hypothetical protein
VVHSMVNRLISITIFSYLTLISSYSLACTEHFDLNPGNYGFIKGAVIRLAGLSPPEPVFKLKHPPVAKAVLGKKSQVIVAFERPWFSKNVQMQLESTSGIKLTDKSIALDDMEGSVSVGYTLETGGFNTITIQVTGEHKGQTSRSRRVIYVRAEKTSLEVDNLQVSVP